MEITEIYLSVIIPCYNEEENLKKGVLIEVESFLSEQNYEWEVIIVDDESTDNSLQLIRSFVRKNQNFRFSTISHGGKPAAIWKGIKQANGEVVLFTDMDQSTPIREFEKLLKWYDSGYEVVIGSRGFRREGFSALRRVGSFIFRTIRRSLLLWDISDTQCGFKSCKRVAALKTFPRLLFFKQQDKPKGWKVSAYDVELLYLFSIGGYKIKEVKVDWENRDVSDTKTQESPSKQYIRESVEMLWEVIRVLINKLSNNY